MPDLVDRTRAAIETRRTELVPSVEEYNQLQAALEVMGGPSKARVTKRRRGPGRPPPRKPARPASKQRAASRTANARGAAAGGTGAHRGSRAAQMLAEIKANPGLTVLEYATRLKINPTYAHEVVKRLKADGTARAKDHRWYPTAKAA